MPSAPDGGGVVVVGSINVDYVVRVQRRPAPGETVSDGALELHPGGKGANQAVAAAYSGAPVQMVARVGEDAAGTQRLEDLRNAGVGTGFVSRSPGAATGSAFITVTPDGENTIVVATGANGDLGTSDVERASAALAGAAVLVAQLEVPLPAVARAVALAGPQARVVLNCAPARALGAELLRRVDVLVVNEPEGAVLTGRPISAGFDAFAMAEQLVALGPTAAVVTLGAGGAVVVGAGVRAHVPAPSVVARDTTGAGDAFVGALAATLALSGDLAQAVAAGVVLGSAVTEVDGAAPPRRPS